MELPVHQQFTNMIADIFHIPFYIIFTYTGITVIYLLVIGIAGRIFKREVTAVSPHKKRIAVLIPSYNEDAVIIHTARAAAEHDYPADLFDVFIAADHMSPNTLALLRQLRVKVYPLHFERGSKARSLNFLLNTIEENKYDIALVLDGDNIMATGFLNCINTAFQKGCRAVQGHRIAKNKNTPVAVLDALSEEINNHLFRKAQRALGLSSATIGSGMAFEFLQLKNIYNKPGIVDNPACDREVDFELMKAGITVEYLEDAFVFDEKVAVKKVFENQRRRWIESQLLHLQLFINEKVVNKGRDYWNKLFLNLIPPRSILLLLFLLIFLLLSAGYILRTDITGIDMRWWVLLFTAYIISLLIAIPPKMYSRSTLKALMHLPRLLLSYLRAVLTLRVKRKEFVHTPKTYTVDPNNRENS